MTVYPQPPAFAQALGVPMFSPNQRQHLGFLLDGFCDTDPEIAHAIAVAVDGIPLAASNKVGDDVRDQLAAAASAQMSMANGISDFMKAGGVDRIVIDLHGG